MDTMQAFMMGEMARAAKNPMVYFDWVRAAHLIRDYEIENASAGLAEDWGWTGDSILKNGKPVLDSEPYLCSCWATPILRTEDGKEFECLTQEKPDNPHAVWPKEALEILNPTGE